jgi:hypothetical protein
VTLSELGQSVASMLSRWLWIEEIFVRPTSVALQFLNFELTWKSASSLLRRRRKHWTLGDAVAMIAKWVTINTRSSVRRFSTQAP